MDWCFATVNKKLAEIYFEEKNGKIKFLGHCYADEKDFRSKEDKEFIKKDTANLKLVYRKGKYRRVKIESSRR